MPTLNTLLVLLLSAAGPCHFPSVTVCEPQHLGIVSDIGVIHSYAKARAVVEHALDPLWRSRIRGAYRFRGVASE